MKYFICAIDIVNSSTTSCIGIPAEHTARIIPASRELTSVYEKDNDEAFISIPALFNMKDNTAPHGLVLKSGLCCSENNEIKTILLTPRIDIELEIPDEHIYELPVVLDEMLKYFRGAYFTGTGQSVILILDPVKLMAKLSESFYD